MIKSRTTLELPPTYPNFTPWDHMTTVTVVITTNSWTLSFCSVMDSDHCAPKGKEANKAFGDGPRHIKPLSSDEDDTCTGIPFLNFHTTATSGRLSIERFYVHRPSLHEGSSVIQGHTSHKCLEDGPWYFLPLGLEKTCKYFHRFWTVAATLNFWPSLSNGQGNGFPSSSLVPQKTHRVGRQCTLNLSRFKLPPIGVVWKIQIWTMGGSVYSVYPVIIIPIHGRPRHNLGVIVILEITRFHLCTVKLRSALHHLNGAVRMDFVIKSLRAAARLWKPRKWASWWIVFIKKTVSDACWNFWSMWEIILVGVFRISLDIIHRSLSLSLVGLSYRIRALVLLPNAALRIGHFYDIQQLHTSRSQMALNSVASFVRLIPMMFPARRSQERDEALIMAEALNLGPLGPCLKMPLMGDFVS
ncbi:hypothetical protein TNCV_2339071 [Trichonephila clavipes]|nr:hypothetical protein TNCV_2339071 [Trichonephila clavipes]